MCLNSEMEKQKQKNKKLFLFIFYLGLAKREFQENVPIPKAINKGVRKGVACIFFFSK